MIQDVQGWGVGGREGGVQLTEQTGKRQAKGVMGGYQGCWSGNQVGLPTVERWHHPHPHTWQNQVHWVHNKQHARAGAWRSCKWWEEGALLGQ